jgi:hypothetical protein
MTATIPRRSPPTRTARSTPGADRTATAVRTVALYVDQISEKREDIDFDGKPDVVSRYKNGKLASREADSSEVFELWNKEGAN